jgi:chromosome segregation ATPase
VRRPPTSTGTAHTTTDRKKDGELQQLLAKVQGLQTQLKKTNADLKYAQSEGKIFKKTSKTLSTKLETADAEIDAQRQELLRAGERMEKDRKRAQEEREDLLDDHDDEIDQLKSVHDTELAEQKTRFEQQVQELQDRLQLEESRRRQEGGDYTQDLEDALKREREALIKLNQMDTEQTVLQSNVSKLEMQQTTWTTKVESLTQTQKTAAEREREAEDKLDAAFSLHTRQMSQRQTREAELEQTISDLGVALTVSRQKEASQMVKAVQQTTTTSVNNNDAEESLKDKYERTAEELDTVKVQLSMETQRREALQQELNEISTERTEEASSAQARQMQHDRKLADLESTISRLQASLRQQKNGSLVQASSSSAATAGKDSRATQELEECKREIAGLSEQLLRQQGRAEVSKSEILALKGRLQSATIRAEAAEKSATAHMGTPSSTTQIYQMEGGGGVAYSNPGVKRRVKGGMGRVRGGSSSVRSIRSALNLGSGRTGPGMEQIVATIDGIDSWMVDTGSFLRHEPLARLGFLCYIMTLHLWTFALVAFHTTEVPHGDFGSMDNNPRHWRAHA